MKMKRILSITVALLLLMLALAACGGNSEEPAETESTEVTETTEEPAETTEESAEPAEEVEEAAETVAETSDLMALANQMIQEAGITDAIPVSAEALTNVYGLDPAQIVAAAGYNAASGGAFPQEIVLVQASSADNAAAVAQAFTNRLSDIAAQAESYDPDSLALAQKCSVVTNGDYVGLFFSEHYDQFVDLFQNGLN
jgi:ABC-type transport system substrate-binding protein